MVIVIARLARRAELVARDTLSGRRSAAQLCGGGDAAQDEERHCQVLRCSGRNRGTRWVDDDDLWFASLSPPHTHGAHVPFDDRFAIPSGPYRKPALRIPA